MADFINYNPQTGLSVNTFRNNGSSCGNALETFAECIYDEEEANVSLECYSDENSLQYILDFLSNVDALKAADMTSGSRLDEVRVMVEMAQNNLLLS